MSAAHRLQKLLRTARLRRGLDATLIAAPWLAVAATLAERWSGALAAALVAFVGAAVIALACWRYAAQLDTRWLARRLNARRADMDDSADLLFAEPSRLGALQSLQRARLQHIRMLQR